MATTPIELVTVGKVAPRDGALFAGVAPSVVEVFPGVFIIATIVRTKNQCILELVQPIGGSTSAVENSSNFVATNNSNDNNSSGSTYGGSPSSALPRTANSLPQQRRLSEPDGVPRHRSPTTSTSAAAAATTSTIPMALKSGFRVPRVIQLVAEDEGVIETVALVREPLGSAFVAALEEQDRAATKNPLRDPASPTAPATAPSVNHLHVHFFIGTSNGTVIIGNALRGTILAVAQFQYHHSFDSELRGTRSTTTATMAADSDTTTATARSTSGDGVKAETRAPTKNQAVVKFVVREKREEQLWNPSLPFLQEGSVMTAQDTRAAPKKAVSTTTNAAAAAMSPTVGSRVSSVYVVHGGGKVVELTRAALDVCVRASVDRLDGRRPHLILEWEPETSPSAFPVAGPACDFAAHVSGVFVLEPPSSYASVERRTASTKSASPESTRFAIRDADVLIEMSEQSAAGASSSSSPLLAPLDAHRRPTELLLVGGSSPLFSFYHLQSPSSGFSASNAVKAVKNMVTGVARSLWFSALGTTNPVERPPHLKKVGAANVHAFLQADAKCGSVQVDPTQQWAAFGIEGGGRVYVADVRSGVVSCVLKGCRAAQFTWWWTDAAAGRPALLLVVYLPLRRAVEVYAARTWERLAACHVPDGCVLLRTCGAPSKRRSGGDVVDNRSLLGSRQGTSVCSGCGGGALLMDPAGNVYEVGVRWVLSDAAANASSPLAADASVSEAREGQVLLDPSVLRGCRTPDDFLEVALQLPLPQPHLVLEETSPLSPAPSTSPAAAAAAASAAAISVRGGDEVRRYSKALELLCATVQRRFAPGYAEIVVSLMPCTPAAALDSGLAAVPRNTTAAQCLHFVRTYRLLVENYYRLLSCRRVVPSRYFNPEQWTSGVVTADLWRENFSTVSSPATIAFVKQMEEQLGAMLATSPAEQNIFKQYFTAHLYQVMRKVPPATAAQRPSLADPGCLMRLPTFLRCFFCGTARPSFLRTAIESVEDADGSVNFLGPLSDLVFGVLGLDGFFTQLPALTDLGCTDGDVALLVITWVSRQGGRSLTALLTSTTIGVFAATLLAFTDGAFLHALDRAAIPFLSVDGDVAAGAAGNSIAALLWCCEVRVVLRPPASQASRQRFTRRVRQLLQLWHALTKGAAAVSPEKPEASGALGTDARIAFSLRLSSVEPSVLPLSSAAAASFTGAAGDDARPGEADGACPTEGDAIEVYLQRNGISISLLDNFVVPRPDADADAVRNLPLFATFVNSLGTTEHLSSHAASRVNNISNVADGLPWIENHQWDSDRFRNEVTKPLEKLWLQLSTAAAGEKSARMSLGGTLRNGAGAAASEKAGRASVYQSCLLLVAMSVLEHALRPLTDVPFFFWDNSTIPDGNFFPVAGAPEGLTLSGSRTSRDYLKSVQKLAALVESMLQQAVAPLENVDRVLLIQRISVALSEDDALLFPLVPNFLRARLTTWMQVLAQAPHAPLRRVQRVSRLADLLLFFTETSAMTMGGVALTQLQSQMSVPWRELIGGANRRDQLRLLPDELISGVETPSPPPPPAPATRQAGASALSVSVRPHEAAGLALSAYAVEDESPASAPLNVAVAAAVLRRFLVAGRVLYAQQRGQLVSSPAPTPCLGLIAEDTRQCLSRLAHCLGLHEARPDIADVALMDYEIKNFFPIAAIEQEMLLLSTKSAPPQVATSVLQCLLVQVLQYVSTQRKAYGQRGDRGSLEIASEQLRKLVEALTPESRAWLQQRETEMLTATPDGGSARESPPSATSKEGANSTTAASVSTDALLCDSSWVSVTEFQDMRRLVFYTLGLPKGTPERKNFFQLLFTLSQWSCEGRLMLPTSLQRIARELPIIVERWEKTV